MIEKFILLLLSGLIAFAIFAPVKPKPVVSDEKVAIILGDKSGKKNAISIASKTGTQRVDKPLTQVKIKEDGNLTKPVKISKEELQKDFSDVIDAMPQKVFSTNIFFKKGIVLNDDYIIRIFQIKNEIKRREPCEVDIIGHSDTKGSKEKNLNISQKRANLIKKLLEVTKVKIAHINLLAYGETNLLVNTKDEVEEPKNRRVEVIIK